VRGRRDGATGRGRAPSAVKPLVVLIADDDPDTRDLYQIHLTRAGMTVETAVNGAEALDKAIRLMPDVIVMDVSMPVLEGDRATALLKASSLTQHIPVLTMTAFGSLARAKARRSGADDFREKPCLPQEIEAAVLALAGRSRLGARPRRTARLSAGKAAVARARRGGRAKAPRVDD
jgi:two-component system response regulator VanR